MVKHPGGPCEDQGSRPWRHGRPDPRKIRLFALMGVVVSAVVLPLAVASAGPAGDESRAAARSLQLGDAGRGQKSDRDPGAADDKVPSVRPTRSPLLLGLGLATAARCGPEVVSPDGVEAQTCVLNQGDDTWARTYYRNATGDALEAVLSLMGPGGRTVQMRCALDGDDEPGTCETPRQRIRDDLEAYTAVAEFAAPGGRGPLLLRSGSNSPVKAGS